MNSKSKIATMAEPTQALAEQCLVMLVFYARELLSDAEREHRRDLERPRQHPLPPYVIAEAISYLRTASALIENERVVYADPVVDVSVMLLQAVQAAKSAEAQVALHDIYLAGEDATIHQTEKQRPLCRRACEAAKNEAHRVLVELLDIYPDAWEAEP